MLTMRPQRLRTIGITSGRVTLKNPSSDVRVTRSQSSSARVGKGESLTTPALLTTTSIVSPSPLQGASAAAVAVASATSKRSSVASPPAAAIASRTSAAPRSSLR